MLILVLALAVEVVGVVSLIVGVLAIGHALKAAK